MKSEKVTSAPWLKVTVLYVFSLKQIAVSALYAFLKPPKHFCLDMSDTGLQDHSAVNYRKRTGSSGRQTERSLSQWQNSHMEEKPERGREGGSEGGRESTDGSDIAEWCAGPKSPMCC